MTIFEVVIREEPPILEVLTGVSGVVEGGAELVELIQSISPRPGEAAEGLQVRTTRVAATEADDPGNELDAGNLRRAAPLLLPLPGARTPTSRSRMPGSRGGPACPFQRAPRMIPTCDQGLELGESNPEKPVVVFRQQLDPLDRRCRVPRRPPESPCVCSSRTEVAQEEGNESVDRVYISGVASGQTSIFALARDGRRIVTIQVSVGRDVGGLTNLSIPPSPVTIFMFALSPIRSFSPDRSRRPRRLRKRSISLTAS